MKKKNPKVGKLVLTLTMVSILLVQFFWSSLAFAAKEQTIEFWTMSSKGAKLYDWEIKVIKDFEKAYPNIRVKHVLCGEEGILIRLKGAFVTGNPPDVYYQDELNTYHFARAGNIYDLTETFEQDKEWKERFIPSVLNHLKESYGGYYGMPVTVRTNGFWYNVDIFKKFGLTTPTYWSEFLDICETLKANEVTPLFSDGAYYSLYLWYPLYLSQRLLGIDYIKHTAYNDDPERYSWKNPAYLKAARLEYELTTGKKYFQEHYQGYVWPTAQIEFSQGKMAMGLMPTWVYEELKKPRPPGFHMKMFRFPMIKGGKGDPTLAEVWTNVWAVTQGSRKKEAAVKFLKFASTPEAAQDLVNLVGTIPPVRGIAWPEELEEAKKMLETAGRTMGKLAGFPAFHLDWLDKVMYPLHDKFFLGQLTPEEFIEKLDAAHKKYFQKS